MNKKKGKKDKKKGQRLNKKLTKLRRYLTKKRKNNKNKTLRSRGALGMKDFDEKYADASRMMKACIHHPKVCAIYTTETLLEKLTNIAAQAYLYQEVKPTDTFDRHSMDICKEQWDNWTKIIPPENLKLLTGVVNGLATVDNRL